MQSSQRDHDARRVVSFTKALRDLTDFNKPPRGISSMDEIKVVASMESLPSPPDVDG